MTIRKAKPSDCTVLTELTFQSKAVWNYPEEYLEVWRDELTITEGDIQSKDVFVAEEDGVILGYYSIAENPEDMTIGEVFVKKGLWLEHLFVTPERIGRGIGTRLYEHALETCRRKGVQSLNIFADPNSKGFYDKLGARYVGESPSNILGRTVPLYEATMV